VSLAEVRDAVRGERLARDLLGECLAGCEAEVIAYRNGHRWLQGFEPLRLDEPAEPLPRLRARGVYLIPGGLGGIGLAIAQLVVGAVLGVLVPLVLSLLSIVFGRALRRAGEDVRRAGDHALAAIDASRTALAMQSEQGDRVRAEAKGVRVGGAPERMTEEEEQEEEAPSEPRARSRRETK